MYSYLSLINKSFKGTRWFTFNDAWTHSTRSEDSTLNVIIFFQNAVTFTASSRFSRFSFSGKPPSPSWISTLFLLANIWHISRKVVFLVSGTTSQM